MRAGRSTGRPVFPCGRGERRCARWRYFFRGALRSRAHATTCRRAVKPFGPHIGACIAAPTSCRERHALRDSMARAHARAGRVGRTQAVSGGFRRGQAARCGQGEPRPGQGIRGRSGEARGRDLRPPCGAERGQERAGGGRPGQANSGEARWGYERSCRASRGQVKPGQARGRARPGRTCEVG